MRKITAIALLALAACNQQNPDSEVQRTTTEEIAPDENVTVRDGLAEDETPAQGDWTQTVAATPEGGFRMGNPNAAVKLVEYGARTCPACGQFSRDAMEPLRERYVASGKVSYEFRDFMVHGIPDVAAALVGQCGGKDAFFPILEATYAKQQTSLAAFQKMDEKEMKTFEKKPIKDFLTYLAERGQYVAIAEGAGLPKGRAQACLADNAAAQRLVDLTNKASSSVQGTPSFQINGRSVDGHDWPSIEKALKAAGA